MTTLAAALDGAAAAHGGRPFVTVDGRTSTYAEIAAGAHRLAAVLARAGVRPGHRVALHLPNSTDHLRGLFALSALGATVVSTSVRFKAREIAHVVADARVAAVLTRADEHGHAERVAGALARLRSAGDALPAVLHLAGDGITGEGPVTRPPGDARGGIVLYTSGTSSRPKGCPLDDDPMLATADAVRHAYELDGDDVFWNPLPLYHVGGALQLLAVVRAGAHLVTAAHFTAERALADLERYRATHAYPAFPTLTERMVSAPSRERRDLGALRALMTLGTPEFLRRTQRAFPRARVFSAYGSTELGGMVTSGRPSDPEGVRLDSCGAPLPGVEIRIVDPGTRRPVQPGAAGEIEVRAPGVFAGYLNLPDVNRAVLAGGRLCTGDMGSLRDGRLRYHGRAGEMFKVGGESVAPGEIADLLMEHPAVRLAVVTAIPDADYGEVPVAFVEAASPVTAQELIALCAAESASYKVPRHVRFVDAWPMSETKVRTDELRAGLLRELS